MKKSVILVLGLAVTVGSCRKELGTQPASQSSTNLQADGAGMRLGQTVPPPDMSANDAAYNMGYALNYKLQNVNSPYQQAQDVEKNFEVPILNSKIAGADVGALTRNIADWVKNLQGALNLDRKQIVMIDVQKIAESANAATFHITTTLGLKAPSLFKTPTSCVYGKTDYWQILARHSLDPVPPPPHNGGCNVNAGADGSAETVMTDILNNCRLTTNTKDYFYYPQYSSGSIYGTAHQSLMWYNAHEHDCLSPGDMTFYTNGAVKVATDYVAAQGQYYITNYLVYSNFVTGNGNPRIETIEVKYGVQRKKLDILDRLPEIKKLIDYIP